MNYTDKELIELIKSEEIRIKRKKEDIKYYNSIWDNITKEQRECSVHINDSLSKCMKRLFNYSILAYARGLNILSPYIEGNKTGAWESSIFSGKQSILPEDHEKEWSGILDGLKGVVDIVAFQDGHVDFFELSDYLAINRKLTDKFGMECWTNCETFDREMPIKFLPLKWEKVLLKLKAAETAGAHKAITFEFSHFMSPQSAYIQAHHLYNRYLEYFGIK